MNYLSPGGLFDEKQWIDDQLQRYGPIIGGEVLRTFFGFRTYAAFQKARRLGEIEVAVFRLPGRQGVFAMTTEACAWLVAQRRTRGASMDAAQKECSKENQHGSP